MSAKKISPEPNGYERRKLLVRQNILDAAEKLVRDTGGTDFSMLQLSQAAGVSPATPFNHFGSKNAIFADMINQSLHAPRKTSKLNSHVDEVVNLFVGITRLYSNDPELFRPVFYSIIAQVNRASSGLQTAIRQILTALEKAKAAGEIRAGVNLEVLAEQLESFWIGSLLLWINSSIDNQTWIRRVEQGLLLMLFSTVTETRQAQITVRLKKLS
jgi:AcrR family transcriptional regulator